MKLNDADLSFVVQGPIVTNSEGKPPVYSTNEVLLSIRKNFPSAEIVLSTWKNSNVEALLYDLLVLNDDPGPLTINGANYNVNRLIESTVNGLNSCKNDYVVKTRTDIIFTSNALLTKIKNIIPINGRYKLFQKKILTTNFYVRDPLKSNVLYHPSDILLMGKKNDVLSLFNHDLVAINDFKNTKGEIFPNKVVNEQYLFIQTIKKAHNLDIIYSMYWEYKGIKNLVRSENFIFKNFLLCSPQQLGVAFPEKLYASSPELNYSNRALKWYHLIKSNIVTDFVFFRIIRAYKYYLMNNKRLD